MPNNLSRYRSKRDFRSTSEPVGGDSDAGGNLFMVHKHDATRLHYDLRLQIGGVLKSWAVPKGPSLDPGEKRLAVEVEEHPLEYGAFEGVIPEGQYGAGPTLVWDTGVWAPMGDIETSLKKGTFKFRLAGEKLRGGWTLVRLKKRDGETKDNWLLIKEPDDAADTENDILVDRPESVLSGLTVEDLASRAAKKNKERPKPRKLRPGSLKGAVRAPMPKTFKPQLASAATEPPAGDGWMHEIKFDGYRTIAMITDGRVRLLTRNGHDWTERYGALADAFLPLGCRSAVLDGEVVVLDAGGVSRFEALQAALAASETHRLIFYAFDLAYLNGWDLTGVPLQKRKALLEKLLAPVVDDDTAIQVSDHVVGQGSDVFDQACAHELEGVVSKRIDSTYTNRRSRTWLKVKAHRVGTFPIVGYTVSREAGGLAALLLAEEIDGDLRFAGKVGTGFTRGEVEELEARLGQRLRDDPPLDLPGKPPKAHWVTPGIKAVVRFRDRTQSGHLRHPVFMNVQAFQPSGNRQSKARQLISDADLANIWVTNPDRRMFSRKGPTKLDLAIYYAKVGNAFLPHILERPVSFVRCPTGKAADCFFQRHAFTGMPDEIDTFAPENEKENKDDDKREEKDKNGKAYLVIRNAKAYLALAQFGVVEIHPWGCRIDRPDRPDRMVFDLDPGENVKWKAIVDAAKMIRQVLQDIGMPAFVKTTGGNGLHVTVPLKRRYSWKRIHDASGAIAAVLAKDDPRRFTTSMARKDRGGRIFIDIHRNVFKATSVAAYSLRARPGLPVSAPVSWADLDSIDAAADLNYTSVPEFLTKYGDPWSDMDRSACLLPKGVGRGSK